MNTEIQQIDHEAMQLLNKLNGPDDLDTIKIPFLRIQYDDIDKQNREVPKGTFTLNDGEEPIYSSTAKIRVLAQHFQYRESDPSTYKIVNKTVLMDNMAKKEPRDMKGGVRCGRPDGKTLKQLSDEEQRSWRNKVPAYRILRGLVSMTGKTADGKEITIENKPFQMYQKGLNFMRFENQVQKALPNSTPYYGTWVDCKTHRDGKAWLIDYSIDHTTDAAMPSEIVETIKVFLAMKDQENGRIQDAYKSASGGEIDASVINQQIENAEEALEAELT